MADPIVIEFAGEPVPKGRPRFARTGNGRTVSYTPAKTRHYESALRYAAQMAMEGRPPLTGPLSVSVIAYLPLLASWSQKARSAALRGILLPAKKPDLDNLEKAALDACEGVVFGNDSQVCFKMSAKRYGEKPRLRIEVAQITEQQEV